MKKLLAAVVLIIIISFSLTSSAHADLATNQSMTASIFPQISDFQFSFARDDGGLTIGPGKTYTYDIVYGAKQSASFPTNNTITVTWVNNTANGIPMFDYVLGSATTGYNNAQPVFDPLYDTITWTIPSLPEGTTDQKVSFQLYSNGDYTGPTQVTGDLFADMRNQYVVMPQQVLPQTYQYVSPPPGPTPTGVPQPTAASIPTPTTTPLSISNVEVTGISDHNATVQTTTSQPTKITVNYGTSPSNLNQTVSTSSYQYRNTVTLSNLHAKTRYYFRITLTNQDGQTLTSEFFTFLTASLSTTPQFDNNMLVFASNGNIFNSSIQKQNAGLVILTVNSDFQLAYLLTQKAAVKSISTVVENKILGANTLAATQLPISVVIPMTQKSPTLYTADFKATQTGLYEVFVRVTDASGNVLTKKITDLKIMPHFVVYAQDTLRPLPDARVYLTIYNPKTHRYEPMQKDLLGSISNPSYTNYVGESPITLPAGKYRVVESAFLYDSATSDFTVGAGANQNYPIVYLKKDPFNFGALFSFVKEYLGDSWSNLTGFLKQISLSVRIFNLISVGILAAFVITNILLFTLRSQIKMHYLPVYFFFHIDRMFNRHQQKYIYGTITDENGKPVSQTSVEFEDHETKNIVVQTTTNKSGRFYTRNSFAGEFHILVTKPGYEVTTVPLNGQALPENGLHVILIKGTDHHHTALNAFFSLSGWALGLLFETSLVMTVLLELLFFFLYGFVQTAPYLLISILNILVWIFYLKEREHTLKDSNKTVSSN